MTSASRPSLALGNGDLSKSFGPLPKLSHMPGADGKGKAAPAPSHFTGQRGWLRIDGRGKISNVQARQPGPLPLWVSSSISSQAVVDSISAAVFSRDAATDVRPGS